MPSDNIDTLQARLARLREKERTSRTQASRIVREMAKMDRNRRVQFLITLGSAWVALGEQSPGARATMQRFIDNWISRPTDIEVLKSTPWAVNAPTAETAREAAYDSDDSEHA
jgi:hypothetical protein